MSHQSQHIYEFESFRLDVAERLLLRDGEVVPLQPKVFDLLLALVERHGRLLEKDELMKLVWPDTVVEEANLANNISILRKTLGENGERFIETVPKRGYRFVAGIRKVADERAEPTSQQSLGSQSAAAEGEPAAKAATVITERPAPEAKNLTSKIKSYRRGALLALVALAMPGMGLFYFMSRPPLAPKVTASAQITNTGRGKSFYTPTNYRMSSALVTDGPRIYFTQGHVPTQVSSVGGEAVRIPESFANSTIGDISPNRSELLVSRGDDEYEGSLWVLPVLGSPPRRLGNLLGHDPTWTPDGQQIVYANGPSLYLAKSDGTDPRKFVTVEGRPYWPRWSPDGSRLRFTVTNKQNSSASLWEVAADGSNPHPLLPGWNNPANECCGNWTADGRYFVFHSTRNQMTNIWARREQTGLFQRGSQEPVQLTVGPLNYYFPAPSLDGKKLFVVGEQKRGELVRYDAGTQQLVRYLQGSSDEYLDFSRDGEWVAYVTYPEGNLWRSKVDGEERRQLSFSPMQVVWPRWSPDGKQIVFTGSMPGKPWKTYLVSAEGGTPQQLTPDERAEHDPGWSSDGNTLVFHAGTPRDPSNSAIYLLEMNTRQLSKLPSSEGLQSPRWSPDGRYIAAHNLGLQNRLLLFDFTTQKWTELLSGKRAGGPHWSRDGKYIYFLSTLEGGRAIFRVGIGDRKVELWASLKGSRLAAGVFGAWIGWTLDDQPLMLRDVGTQDIYALEWQTP
jgi:Tol biopolymer transport system component/DNA-binding winged helix-turn-helix (wHTH) protein